MSFIIAREETQKNNIIHLTARLKIQTNQKNDILAMKT